MVSDFIFSVTTHQCKDYIHVVICEVLSFASECIIYILLFFSPAIPSVIGLFYLYARYKYFYGYAEAGEKRYAYPILRPLN